MGSRKERLAEDRRDTETTQERYEASLKKGDMINLASWEADHHLLAGHSSKDMAGQPSKDISLLQ